jgi:hypothetical protein
MGPMYCIRLDVSKRTITDCVKDASEGSIPATRIGMDRWLKTRPPRWSAAMEATLFTGWI